MEQNTGMVLHTICLKTSEYTIRYGTVR